MSAAHSDLIGQILDAMHDAGCAPHDPGVVVFGPSRASNRTIPVHRYRVDGDKSGSENGWFLFYDDGIPAGAFGSWKTGQTETWCAKGEDEISDAEREQRDRHLAAAKAHRAKEEIQVRAHARQRAADLWGKSRDTVDAKHPYLLKKQIPAIGARQLQNSLVIPVQDAEGVIHSLQFIGPDGVKKFLTGGAIRGNFARLPGLEPVTTVLVCEGYATGISLHRASGCPVYVAFNAGNLEPVARAVRRLYPAARLIVAGDDDRWTDDNPGRAKALVAAGATGGRAIFPQFEDVRLHPTDFNDWEQQIGPPALAERLAALIEQPPPEPPPPDVEPPGPPPSEIQAICAALRRAKNGEPFGSAANIAEILGNHPAWSDVLAFDAMSNQITKRRPPPYPKSAPGPWKDADEIATAIWLEREFDLRAGGSLISAVANLLARYDEFHEVRDWLTRLPPWDGTDRLTTFFSDYCGSSQTAYTAAVGRAFFVSAAARVMAPGCKVDTMLVLEGEQGIGKSQLILALFGKAWHIEISYAPGSLDFYQALRGTWCAEFGELASFDKSDMARVKQVLSQVQDTYRASFGHHVETHPRQTIFVGSTNKREWGLDETGLRRFWPIACKEVNLDAIRDIREQLWAEGLARYKAGETWWEIPDAKQEQDYRYDADAWEETVAKWIETRERLAPGPFTVNDVYLGAIHATNPSRIPPITRADQIRLGRILGRLGWQKHRATGGPRAYHYEKAAP